MKLFLKFVIVLVILSSCSGDNSGSDNNDIIIGKWLAIEQYENDQLVTLPTCAPHTYVEYNANKSISGGRIMSDDFPEECYLMMYDLAIVWKNLGNNKYRIGYYNEEGSIFTIYKEGVNLVIENPDGITKTIYKPYP
jgi:hypothetical protein